MDWKELVEKQGNDYKQHIENYKKSREQLKQDKEMLLKLAGCKEADLPEEMKGKLARDREEWEARNGMYGSEFKDMRKEHMKELNTYCNREDYSQNLRDKKEKNRDKDNDKER